ncbi:MAG: SAM-dependent methyltransferase [Betaproteobacteria bacterium]
MTGQETRGTLYLVPNLLGIVPPEAVLPAGTIAVARRLRHFVVENAKPARQFLKSLALEVPVATLRIVALPQPLQRQSLADLLAPLRQGEDVGLLSDAGCPGVADPGAALVAAAHRGGIRVVPLVGPSALLLGLMASGFNGQSFRFNGYLPVARAERGLRLRTLDDEIAHTGCTQIFIETPYRNQAMLDTILDTCRNVTALCVAVDLTLPTEWISSAAIAMWRQRTIPALAKRPALFLLGHSEGPAAPG